MITGFTILGQPEINRLAIGVGMIPRREVGLVFTGVGSVSGTLSRPLEAAIIVMVISTTFLAPPMQHVVFQSSDTGEPALSVKVASAVVGDIDT